MRSIKARLWLLCAIAVCCGALLLRFEIAGREPDGVTGGIFALPMEIGEWHGREMPVSPDVRELLETRSVLMRAYRKGGKKVLLTIVYYKDSRVALHLPESCYTGQGSAVVERGREKLDGFDANMFLLSGHKGEKAVLYYFVAGDLRTASYAAMRWRMLKNRLSGGKAGCALVRLSTERTDAGPDSAVLREFSRAAGAVLLRHIQ